MCTQSEVRVGWGNGFLGPGILAEPESSGQKIKIPTLSLQASQGQGWGTRLSP